MIPTCLWNGCFKSGRKLRRSLLNWVFYVLVVPFHHFTRSATPVASTGWKSMNSASNYATSLGSISTLTRAADDDQFVRIRYRDVFSGAQHDTLFFPG